MKHSRGRALNDNYAALLDHYGLHSTRINRGQSHENGVAEQGHYRLEDALDQALILRGSRDFNTAGDYAGFVRMTLLASAPRFRDGQQRVIAPRTGVAVVLGALLVQSVAELCPYPGRAEATNW